MDLLERGHELIQREDAVGEAHRQQQAVGPRLALLGALAIFAVVPRDGTAHDSRVVLLEVVAVSQLPPPRSRREREDTLLGRRAGLSSSRRRCPALLLVAVVAAVAAAVVVLARLSVRRPQSLRVVVALPQPREQPRVAADGVNPVAVLRVHKVHREYLVAVCRQRDRREPLLRVQREDPRRHVLRGRANVAGVLGPRDSADVVVVSGVGAVQDERRELPSPPRRVPHLQPGAHRRGDVGAIRGELQVADDGLEVEVVQHDPLRQVAHEAAAVDVDADEDHAVGREADHADICGSAGGARVTASAGASAAASQRSSTGSAHL